MRIKKMPLCQFQAVMRRKWAPVQLIDDAIPRWLRSIPATVVHSVYASGSEDPGIPHSDPHVPSGSLIGGIDVYRKAPDDPCELNKDWYAVIVIPGSDDMLLVRGPIKDAEHWLNDIPNRLKGAEILAVPPKIGEMK